MQPTMQAQHISSTEPSHNINPTTSCKAYQPIADPCCNSTSDLQYKNHFLNLAKQCMLQDKMPKPPINASPIIHSRRLIIFYTQKSQSVSHSTPFNHSPTGFTFTLSQLKISIHLQPSLINAQPTHALAFIQPIIDFVQSVNRFITSPSTQS